MSTIPLVHCYERTTSVRCETLSRLLLHICGAVCIGCYADPFVPAVQNVSVRVCSPVDQRRLKGVSITHLFGTAEQKNDPDRIHPVSIHMLEDRSLAHMSEGISDGDGFAVIPAAIDAPASFFGRSGAGSDQVSGSVSIFRVSSGASTEYLVDRNVRAGDQLVGSAFILRIMTIGQPELPKTTAK